MSTVTITTLEYTFALCSDSKKHAYLKGFDKPRCLKNCSKVPLLLTHDFGSNISICNLCEKLVRDTRAIDATLSEDLSVVQQFLDDLPTFEIFRECLEDAADSILRVDLTHSFPDHNMHFFMVHLKNHAPISIHCSKERPFVVDAPRDCLYATSVGCFNNSYRDNPIHHAVEDLKFRFLNTRSQQTYQAETTLSIYFRDILSPIARTIYDTCWPSGIIHPVMKVQKQSDFRYFMTQEDLDDIILWSQG